jgi:hypothetical protein
VPYLQALLEAAKILGHFLATFYEV